MRIVIYGATGRIGGRITTEALAREHQVTAPVREPSRVPLTHPQLTVVQGDVLDMDSVAAQVRGSDAVVSAIGPNLQLGNYHLLKDAAYTLIDGLQRGGVRRLLVVGGAGSLEVAPGVRLIDSPRVPEAYKPVALAHLDVLPIYQKSDLDWTVFNPPPFIEPGERTGTFRHGTNQLVTDENGQSRISMEDYAVALLDELENPRFKRQHFTAAY